MFVMKEKKKKEEKKRGRSKSKDKKFDKEKLKYDEKDSISLKKHGDWHKFKMSLKGFFKREKA